MKPRIPPPVIMLAAARMWLLHRRMPLALWIAPTWNQFGSAPAALGLAIGIGIGIAAVVRLHQARTTTSPMDPDRV